MSFFALSRARQALPRTTALFCWAWLGFACSAQEPTEIVGGVTTQIKVPEYLRSVGITVQVGGRVRFCETYPVTGGLTVLPATLGLLGAAGLAPTDTVTVQVLGLRAEASAFDTDCFGIYAQQGAAEPGQDDNREVLVIRRRRLTFVDGRILYLPLPLKESCQDQACPEDQTCVAGACVPMDVNPKTLPDYHERLAFGTTNTCFNGDLCLPSAATFPAQLLDPATCTFHVQWSPELPQPSPGDLNVRMFYNSFGSEVLDIDPTGSAPDQQEGFSFPDPDDPFTFQLAPNLCSTNYQKDRILAVEASAFCPAKRGYQPICEEYSAPNPRSGAPAGSPGGLGVGLCTIAALEPVESVVYVLMDRSFRMYPFYGDGGLRFAIELPLSSPVARRTSLAFGPLPADPTQCGSNAYATPQVDFGGVADVRQPIADILSTLDSVLPDNPPQVALEAALQGAYSAVANQPVLAPDGFAQRAVVVISNRDIDVGACMGGPTATALAQQAAQGANPIATYAVALGDPNEDNPTADASTVASASALATAGKTRVFDGVADGAKGATAVLDVLTDLGTCVYRVNRLDLGAIDLPPSALLSYVDPLSPSSSAVDIPYAAGCSATAPSDVSGWAAEGGRVRICGQACTALRNVVSRVTTVALQQKQQQPDQQFSAPPVPVVVSAPCTEFQLHQP
jgi:hypothetical protein